VIDELGVRDRIEAAGFTRKYGVSLLWGAQRDLWSVAFGEGGPYDYTWQVKWSHLLTISVADRHLYVNTGC
jgi:hypothetical protein